jgi:uncharacterized membrane protein
MTVEDLLTALAILSLFVVLFMCSIGALVKVFDDTFAQRVALGLVAMGALAQVSLIATRGTDPHTATLCIAIGVYSIATAIKYYRRWKRSQAGGHPFRRTTDFAVGDYPYQPAEERKAA